MRWLAFAIVAWALLGLEVGFKDALQVGAGPVAPSFVMALVVFVALHAPALTAAAAGLVIGLALDLTHAHQFMGAPQTVVIVGPYAIGCMCGAYAVVAMRSIVMRHNPLTFAFLTVMGAMIMHVVVSALMEARSIYDVITFDAGPELMARVWISLYTGVVAVPLGWLLQKSEPVFRFAPMGSVRRRY
ncbi:MAG: hypothetical protein AB7G17_10335 [Phycisphaerales bacterium]